MSLLVKFLNIDRRNTENLAHRARETLNIRAENAFDWLQENLILIFAGAMLSVIVAVVLTWISLEAKHETIGHLIARSF